MEDYNKVKTNYLIQKRLYEKALENNSDKVIFNNKIINNIKKSYKKAEYELIETFKEKIVELFPDKEGKFKPLFDNYMFYGDVKNKLIEIALKLE